MAVLPIGFCAALALACALGSRAEPAPRVEHFALMNGASEVVGTARLLQREQAEDVQLELELEHFALASTLRLVETHGRAGAANARHELVWREHFGTPARPAGRCVVARWTERGELETLQWGALEPVRGERALAARPLFPLEQWESERRGERRDGARYDPLGDRIDVASRVAGARLPGAACAGFAPLRCVREAGSDEPLAVRRVFAGAALIAFRFGPGAPLAVAIPESRWNELRAARIEQLNRPEAAHAVTGSLPAPVSRDDYSEALVRRPGTR